MQVTELISQYKKKADELRILKDKAVSEAEDYFRTLLEARDMKESIRTGPLRSEEERIKNSLLLALNGGQKPKKNASEYIQNTDEFRVRFAREKEDNEVIRFLTLAMENPELLLTEKGRRFIPQCMTGKERKTYRWIAEQGTDDAYREFEEQYFAIADLPDQYDELLDETEVFIRNALRTRPLVAEFRSARGKPYHETVSAKMLEEYLNSCFDLNDILRYLLDPYNGMTAAYLFNASERVLPLYNDVKNLAEELGDPSHGNLDEQLIFSLCETETDERFLQLLTNRFSKKSVITCLGRNPIYEAVLKRKNEAERQRRELRRNIVTVMPDTYPELYPAARMMRRHFIIHSGPTNSGKTYSAMQELKRAANGVYLAPLRMLALEKYEELNGDGYLCSLRTGEEEKLVEDASFVSSTVEMANLDEQYECAVIDECQMMTDRFRGGAWTAAILGLQAETIHLCLSPWAERTAISLIDACGDTHETIIHERSVALSVENAAVRFPEEIREHDAVIVFSRSHVHSVAAELENRRISCSVIYGNLPYDVRQSEAERFRTGKTKVVVSTDAIGMGLNLPVERVVFLELEKFDGEKKRRLSNEEIRQISGRAGRRGIFEHGYVATDDTAEIETIRNAVNVIQSPDKQPMIGFPKALLGIERPVSELMKEWQKIPPIEGFCKADLSEDILLAEKAESLTDDRDTVYRLSTISVDTKSDKLVGVWNYLARELVSGRLEQQSLPTAGSNPDLYTMEQMFHVYDIYYQFGRIFACVKIKDAAITAKDKMSKLIIAELKRRGKEKKVCRACGRILPWNTEYNLCDTCYRKSFYKR